MAKISFDVTGVEGGNDFDTPVPEGLYVAKVAECDQTTSKSSGNPMLAVTLEIMKGDHKGRKLWDYIVLNDSSAWKLRQFLEALGLVKEGKTSGSFDPDKTVGSAVQVRVKHETTKDFGTRAKVGAMLPMPEQLSLDDVEPEAEAEESDVGWDDLAEYDRDDLEAFHEENELECKFNKRTSDDTLRERIAEEIGIEVPGVEDEDEDEGYDGWSVADLRAEAKERGLKSSGPKSAIVKRLEAADDSDDDDLPF